MISSLCGHSGVPQLLKGDVLKKEWIPLVAALLVFLSLGIALLYNLGVWNRDSVIPEVDCDSRTGIERDECLSFTAQQTQNDALCGGSQQLATATGQ